MLVSVALGCTAPASAGPGWPALLDAQRPRSISVDRLGRVYAVDAARSRILVLSGEGELLRSLGRPGSAADGQFFEPCGVAAGAGFHMAVADAGNGRVVRYATELDGRAHSFDAVLLDRGALAGGLFRPLDLDFDPAGGLAVLDGESRQVSILDPFGRVERSFAGFGDLPGRLRAPSSIAYDRRRGIFVADPGQIVVFDLFGAHRADWPLPGAAHPAGIALDHRGRLAVTLPDRGRVVILSTAGDVAETLAPTPEPIDVAFGPGGRLFVLDGGSGAVHRLPPLP